MMMTETRQTIWIVAFVMLTVLGTAWALEHRAAPPRTGSGAASEVVAPGPRAHEEPGAAVDSQPELDRSDLQLSQG